MQGWNRLLASTEIFANVKRLLQSVVKMVGNSVWWVLGSVSQAETRYSPTEGELLAVADALKKTRFFTLGC